MAKVDPLKLRLSSFQRELAEDALAPVLENIMVSGASRGGVDVNSAPVSWLARLPGMTDVTASAVDTARRKQLFKSRDAILELEGWTSEAEGRQALPFLRVFGSEETLDGTLIHPGDYPLARKLAKTLGVELPPPAPPGYEPPDYSSASSAAASEIRPVEVVQKEEKPKVEEFSNSGEKSPEFAIDDVPQAEKAEAEAATATSESETAETKNAETENAQQPTTAELATEPSAAVAQTDAADNAESSAEPSDEPDAEQAAPQASQPSEAAAELIKHPLPEKAAVDKCIKEWQVGQQRTYQIVHWLCDPFGDSDISGTPPAVLTKVPAMKDLRQGDQVIGVVVGVMPFGVFVELAPDCSGLIHVSRVSDAFVEDLHEAVQVGDVVTAWVTGIDEKKRRVGLSALSPERQAEIEQARRNQRSNTGRGRGQGHGGHSQSGQGAANRGAANRGGGQPGGRAGAGAGRSGKPSGGARDGNRGGGRGRDNRSGKGREKRVESYRVVGKKEEKPISEKMAKGEEPLRSFGDLAQFLGTSKPAAPKKPAAAKKPPKAKPPVASQPPAEEPSSQEPSSQEPSSQEPTAMDPVSSDSQAATPPASPSPTPDQAPATDVAAAKDPNSTEDASTP
jgi:predicted RNA-binding protein with RPS1 domain